jgi:two-component system cell cycle response regulator CpdR
MAYILLAEADQSLRTFLARGLQKVGHKVWDVPDGVSELEAVTNNHFDLLIADIVMPGMDGIEVARRACLELPGLRVMFITGFAAVALKAQSLSPFGANSKADAKVLSKTFHLKGLVVQVEHALAA